MGTKLECKVDVEGTVDMSMEKGGIVSDEGIIGSAGGKGHRKVPNTAL